ncbi:TetR/AcrR family transcriptional regulator [Ferruginibacter sp. HRS2-29]|uniref:TetR/AcrR family transcriptional regulator n=1 Tax=Ferruginibacter sp. HRS2-29 TaxID=2487334 RepID=UPI0020CB7D85|nr:TetR/AcrR family transcriptional regulator [Ferruginibacter sp. HRS2-29]MCP9749682.1 TetR/AcrR family transcriptional regulator [Ferruginibacter sp. HRS2-29]
MASKERIQRLKEETRISILDAAFKIVKNEGWQSLSMRKIADEIEYTAPIIYEYYANKEAILQELTRKGYRVLTAELAEARDTQAIPEKQLEAMWLAYWDFAFAHKEYYQLMFGVEMNCCVMKTECPEMQSPAKMITDVIQKILQVPLDNDAVCTKYYTFWSVVHGLISINIVRQGVSDEINQQILKDAINGIIRSMKD